MVHKILERRPRDGRRPGGGAFAGGRASAAVVARRQRKRRRNSHGCLRRTVLLTSAGATGVCALAACALIAPGLVLGVEGTMLDGDTPARGARVAASFEPAAPGAELLRAATTRATAANDVPPPGVSLRATDTATTAQGSGQVLVTLPWGDGAGEVGLLEDAEGLGRGPEALAVAPDGRVAILDSVNNRLLLLDPAGASLGTASIPLSVPRFLAVDDGRLYVLDCDSDRQLFTFDWRGTVQGAVGLPDLEDVVTGLFATEQGPCLEIAHKTVLVLTETKETQPASVSRARPAPAATRVVAGRPMDRGLGRVAEVSYRPGQNARIRFFQIDDATQKPLQTGDSSPVLAGGRAIDHLVSVDSDGAGGMIIGARLLEPETVRGQAVALALTRVAAAEGHGSTDKSDRTSVGPPKGPATEQAGTDAAGSAGTTTETLLLVDSSFVYLGQPYVVAPDGRIFQPWAAEAGYSILVHSFAGTEEVLP